MKRNVILAVAAGIVIAAWFLAPSAFVHGMIIGIVVTIAALAGGLTLFAKVMAKKRPTRELSPPPLPTASWDYRIALTDIDGNPIDLVDAAGGVVVLNFWATWCAPCVAELPSLQRLRDATREAGVRFAFVTTEESSVVQAFMEKRELDLPIYLLSGDPPECFKGRGIPSTFIVDKSGTIVLRHVGAAAWDAPTVVAFIGGLAARPAK
ncbi:MAG TPA: TlpA disulfide reductase family protein [Gemmatimonadales bacterium]